MRSVTDAKSLSDLRTAIANRVHAKPPQKGTAYLELYLLSMERQRLEKELALLERRRARIQGHLAEIAQAVAKLGQEPPAPAASAGEEAKPPAAPSASQRWHEMDVYY